MGSWVPFLITLMLIAMMMLVIIAWRFFRRVYFVMEDIDARLIQMRKMMEGASRSGKPKQGEGNQQGGAPPRRAPRPPMVQ
ncbi:MAG: hypothetical protein ACYSTL_06890 [Planctomycetota bacterium]